MTVTMTTVTTTTTMSWYDDRVRRCFTIYILCFLLREMIQRTSLLNTWDEERKMRDGQETENATGRRQTRLRGGHRLSAVYIACGLSLSAVFRCLFFSLAYTSIRLWHAIDTCARWSSRAIESESTTDVYTVSGARRDAWYGESRGLPMSWSGNI